MIWNRSQSALNVSRRWRSIAIHRFHPLTHPCFVQSDPERLSLVFRDQDTHVDETAFREALSRAAAGGTAGGACAGL